MFIAAEGLKTVSASALKVGDFCYAVGLDAAPAPLCVVADGGQQIAGKFLLLLEGERAFRAYRLERDDTIVVKAPLDPGKLHFDLGAAVRFDETPGVLSINEEGAFIWITWATAGLSDNVAAVKVGDWTFEGSVRAHRSASFAGWKLHHDGTRDARVLCTRVVEVAGA